MYIPTLLYKFPTVLYTLIAGVFFLLEFIKSIIRMQERSVTHSIVEGKLNLNIENKTYRFPPTLVTP